MLYVLCCQISMFLIPYRSNLQQYIWMPNIIVEYTFLEKKSFICIITHNYPHACTYTLTHIHTHTKLCSSATVFILTKMISTPCETSLHLAACRACRRICLLTMFQPMGSHMAGRIRYLTSNSVTNIENKPFLWFCLTHRDWQFEGSVDFPRQKLAQLYGNCAICIELN